MNEAPNPDRPSDQKKIPHTDIPYSAEAVDQLLGKVSAAQPTGEDEAPLTKIPCPMCGSMSCSEFVKFAMTHEPVAERAEVALELAFNDAGRSIQGKVERRVK